MVQLQKPRMLKKKLKRSAVEHKRKDYLHIIKQDPDKYNDLLDSDLYDVSSMSNTQLNKFLIQDEDIRGVMDKELGRRR